MPPIQDNAHALPVLGEDAHNFDEAQLQQQPIIHNNNTDTIPLPMIMNPVPAEAPAMNHQAEGLRADSPPPFVAENLAIEALAAPHDRPEPRDETAPAAAVHFNHHHVNSNNNNQPRPTHGLDNNIMAQPPRPKERLVVETVKEDDDEDAKEDATAHPPVENHPVVRPHLVVPQQPFLMEPIIMDNAAAAANEPIAAMNHGHGDVRPPPFPARAAVQARVALVAVPRRRMAAAAPPAVLPPFMEPVMENVPVVNQGAPAPDIADGVEQVVNPRPNEEEDVEAQGIVPPEDPAQPNAIMDKLLRLPGVGRAVRMGNGIRQNDMFPKACVVAAAAYAFIRYYEDFEEQHDVKKKAPFPSEDEDACPDLDGFIAHMTKQCRIDDSTTVVAPAAAKASVLEITSPVATSDAIGSLNTASMVLLKNDARVSDEALLSFAMAMNESTGMCFHGDTFCVANQVTGTHVAFIDDYGVDDEALGVQQSTLKQDENDDALVSFEEDTPSPVSMEAAKPMAEDSLVENEINDAVKEDTVDGITSEIVAKEGPGAVFISGDNTGIVSITDGALAAFTSAGDVGFSHLIDDLAPSIGSSGLTKQSTGGKKHSSVEGGVSSIATLARDVCVAFPVDDMAASICLLGQEEPTESGKVKSDKAALAIVNNLPQDVAPEDSLLGSPELDSAIEVISLDADDKQAPSLIPSTAGDIPVLPKADDPKSSTETENLDANTSSISLLDSEASAVSALEVDNTLTPVDEGKGIRSIMLVATDDKGNVHTFDLGSPPNIAVVVASEDTGAVDALVPSPPNPSALEPSNMAKIYKFGEDTNGFGPGATLPAGSALGMTMPACAVLSLAAAFLVYKGYKACTGVKIRSSDMCELMRHWMHSLERHGRPCHVGNVKNFSFDTSNYETLTSGDLKRVLLEGFSFKARSNESKPKLICILCDKYEAALKAMKKADICKILRASGVSASERMKKDDLVILALETGF